MLKTDNFSTFMPSFTTIDSFLSYEDTLSCLSSFEFARSLQSSKVSPYLVGYNVLSYSELAKQLSIDRENSNLKTLESLMTSSDAQSNNLSLKQDLVDEILVENTGMILLAERFQNNRFSLNNHSVSHTEKDLVSNLLIRLKTLTGLIPSKFLVNVDSIRKIMETLHSVESPYQGTILPCNTALHPSQQAYTSDLFCINSLQDHPKQSAFHPSYPPNPNDRDSGRQL